MSGITWELLDRYLSHECGDAERELVERWLSQGRTRPLISESLSEATAAISPSRPEASRRSRRRFAWLIATPAELPRVIPFRLLKLAALAAAVGGVGILGWQGLIRRAREAPLGAGVRVAATPAGQRATFRLIDGTRVVLGVASTLRSPSRFGRSEPREVELTGEAYFEVAPGEGRPFVVRAADVVARDIGTSFLVRAYPEEPHARVVVREGAVAIRPKHAPDTASGGLVASGQVGQLDASGVLVVEEADTTADFSWLSGRLTIDHLPLRDALPQLSRWYDLDFRLADSRLGDTPLSAILGPRLTPDVLDLLARSLGMRQVRNGRTITFYPGTRTH
ncbi:MAG: FecR domain-containing protein [Gemmatimonadales bacterium]